MGVVARVLLEEHLAALRDCDVVEHVRPRRERADARVGRPVDEQLDRAALLGVAGSVKRSRHRRVWPSRPTSGVMFEVVTK